MARLQILELPEGADDTRPPFVLVVDQASEAIAKALTPAESEDVSYETAIKRLTGLSIAEQIGARAVLVFEDTIDIPANEITISDTTDGTDGNVVRIHVEPDLDGFTDKVMAEVAKAEADAMARLGWATQ